MVAKQSRSLLWDVALLIQARTVLPYTFGGCLSLRLLFPWWRCDSGGMLLPHHSQQITDAEAARWHTSFVANHAFSPHIKIRYSLAG